MNLKKLLSLSLLVLAVTVFFASASYAQVLNTVYVNSTNGDDSYTGENATNNPAGTGPKQTIEGGFAAAKDGATIYVDGGTYNFDGSARTDGNGISGGNDSDGITLAGGKSATIILRTFSSFSTVTVPAGGLTINNTTKTITISATTTGVEGIDLTGNFVLTAGTLDVTALGTKFVYNAGNTITRTAGTLVGTPTYSASGDYNVTYNNTAAALQSGPELPADLNDGTLTFSGTKTVTVGAALNLNDGTITTATSTAVFSATVTFDDAATPANGIKVTGAAGSLTFGSVVINSHAALGATYINVGNASSSLSITSLSLNNNSTATVGPLNCSMTVANTGTATFGNMVEASSAYTTGGPYTATISIDNNGAKTFTLGASTLKGTLTNDGGGTVALSGSVSVAGAADNSGSTLKLNGYVFTLKNTAITNTGGTVSDTGGKFVFDQTGAVTVTGAGTFSTVENSNTGVVTFAAATTFSGNVTSTKGGFTFSAAATMQKDLTVTAGTVTLFTGSTVANVALNGGILDINAGTVTVNGNISQSGGDFDYGSATLVFKGNLSRTGGTMTFATGTLNFAASGAQTFDGGANYNVNNLTVTGTATAVTLTSSLVVNGNATISATCSISFGTNNIRMAGDNATFTLSGSYTSTGGGGIIFQAPTADQNIAGAGVYSNIEVNLGDATKHVLVTDVTVKFSGILTTTSGGVQLVGTVGNTAILDPVTTLTTPSIRVNLADNDGAANGTNVPKGTGVTLSGGAGTETFNNAGTSYNLEYFGALDATSTQNTTSEYDVTKLLALTVNTSNGGKLALPAANATMSGDLTVGPNAILIIATGAAHTYTLDKDGGVYSIRGTIDFTDGGGTADILTISGANATVSGYTATADPAYVNAVTNLNSTTKVTVSGIKTFNQTVTTGASSVVDFGLYYKAAGDQELNGLLTVGGTFNLTTKIFADAGVTVAAGGTLNMGAFDIEFKTGAQTLTLNENVTATTGKFYLNGVAGTLDGNGKSIPNVTVKGGALTLGSAVTVGTLCDILTGGSIISGGFDLTIPTAFKTVNGNTFTGAGAVVFTGSTLTLDDAAASTLTLDNLTINSTDTTWLASTSGTKFTLTVSGVLTQTKGTINQGKHDISLTGAGAAYSRTAGDIVQSTGALIFAGAADQTFDTDAGANETPWSIANLTINNTSGSNTEVKTGAADALITVTGTLGLVDGVFFTDLGTTAAGLLHIAAGATIERDAAKSSLNEVPTFDGLMNVTYKTAGGATAKELPTATDKLSDLKVSIGTILSANVTVNGTLTLDAGTLDLTTNTKSVTLASGTTLVDDGGDIDTAPTVTNYNLTYTTAGTSAKEFVTGKVDVLTVDGVTLTLAASKTVADVVMSKANSVIDLTATPYNLTVTGNLNMTNGNITNGGSLILGGTAKQTITVPAAGLTLTANVTLNNAAGFDLTGGNLNLNGGANTTLFFINGVLSTGANRVTLNQTATGQGFNHTGVVTPNVSHIMGNVAHTITAGAGSPTVYANGRYEFPVGTETQYRPYIITFSSAYPAINPTTVVVNHVDASPEGTKNFPLDAGDGLTIGNYPNYYWLVKTTPSSFTSTQNFDVEMHATNIGYPYDSDSNLRIIKRQDGSSESNGWSLQGNSANYSNYQVVTGTDTLAVVRTTSSIGGVVNEGTRFTVGVPSQGPVFSDPTVTDYNMNEGDTVSVSVTAASREIGTDITSITKKSGPDFAVYTSATASTGTLKLTPDFTAGTNDYSVVLTATDARGLTSDITISVTVTNVNRGVEFSTELDDSITARAGDAYSFQYEATDADEDPLTFFLSSVTGDTVSASPTVSEDGLLSWTPATADIGKTVQIIVGVTDGTDSTLSAVGTITVIDNNAPVFTTVLEDQTIEFGQSVSVTYAASDADGDDLTFAFNGESPEGAELDTATGEFTWTPSFNQTAIYLIKVKVTDTHGGVATTQAEITVTGVSGVEGLGIPDEFALEQNYPNPFNPTTVIRYGLPEQSNVVLRVYNILGQEVATLINTVQPAGWHEVNFNASRLSTGLYIYRIEAKDFVSIKKMMLVK